MSPEHFPAANDIGTVTVRYVVETVNPHRAHLAIDAVFVTDAGHRLYASDGSVETAEYAEIMTQIKALEAPKVRHHSRNGRHPGQETRDCGILWRTSSRASPNQKLPKRNCRSESGSSNSTRRAVFAVRPFL